MQKLFWLALFCGAGLFALETPIFHLEDIRIEGTRSNVKDILLAESRLQLEKSYSELELYEAMVRLRRLAFVLDAEFRLEKGSARQTYILVIEVRETRRFFFDSEATFFRVAAGSGIVRDNETVLRNQFTVGYRTFPSSKSQLYAAVTSQQQFSEVDESYPLSGTVGFAHYNLGGEGRFLNAEIFVENERDVLVELPEAFDSQSDANRRGFDFLYAVPVRRSQWLRIGAGWRKGVTEFPQRIYNFETNRLQFFQKHTERQLKYLWVDWQWNTLNDGAMPTNGLHMRTGLAAVEDDSDVFFPNVGDQRYIDYRNGLAGFIVYEQHWEFFKRHSIFLETTGRIAYESSETQFAQFFRRFPSDRVREESDVDFRGSLVTGYSLQILSGNIANQGGDLRLEFLASSSADGDRFDPVAGERRDDDVGFGAKHLSTRLVYRNAWGIFRLALSYGLN